MKDHPMAYEMIANMTIMPELYLSLLSLGKYSANIKNIMKNNKNIIFFLKYILFKIQ